MKNYEINSNTLAVIALDVKKTQIIEEEEIYTINRSSLEIIDNSCKYFGSSYKGRSEGTKNIINYSYKLPIVVDEYRNIIFFPTSSPKYDNCNWLALNKIENVEKNNKNTIVNFKNGFKLSLDISYYSLENQLLRSYYLQSKLKSRRNI